MRQAQTTVHHPASSQNILRTKRQLGSKYKWFTQDICTYSYSDHVVFSAFTSLLWRRPLAPSVILFIPENREQITWFLLSNYITVSPGLAQHLLAIVQHEISRAKMKQSAELEWGREKKAQAGTPLHAAGGETMRQDAWGGFGPGSVPSLHSQSVDVNSGKPTVFDYGAFVGLILQSIWLNPKSCYLLIWAIIQSSHKLYFPFVSFLCPPSLYSAETQL